jgi:hypothetical protein
MFHMSLKFEDRDPDIDIMVWGQLLNDLIVSDTLK